MDKLLFRGANVIKRALATTRHGQVAPPSLPENLFHWRPKTGGQNFGDHLSSVIATKMLADRDLFVDEPLARAGRLLALGSILHFARDGDTVWGSGINGKIPLDELRFDTLDIRAIRGPLTAEVLRRRGIAVPDIYGDPALLLPTLLGSRFAPDPVIDEIFVPNLNDALTAGGFPRTISPLEPWPTCIRAILSARFVIASSLHGIIVAEAFGVPCRYVRLSDNENLFKYNDYMHGTGRGDIQFARSRDEALEMGPSEKLVYDSSRLAAAFPYDLWRY